MQRASEYSNSVKLPSPRGGERPAQSPRASRREVTPLRRFRQSPNRWNPSRSRAAAGRSPRSNAIDRRATDEEINALVTELENLPTFRTFDHATGDVIVHEGKTMPNTAAITERLYEELWTQPGQVADAEHAARDLPLEKQLDLAMISHKRQSMVSLRNMLRRHVLHDEASTCRAQTTFEVTIGDMVSHLGKDTEELSKLRVHYAATDELLHRQARRMAEMELDRFAHHLLSEDVTKVDVLILRLDAFRQKHVPLPPRRTPQALPSVDIK